jgi:hypothetical protein
MSEPRTIDAEAHRARTRLVEITVFPLRAGGCRVAASEGVDRENAAGREFGGRTAY